MAPPSLEWASQPWVSFALISLSGVRLPHYGIEVEVKTKTDVDVIPVVMAGIIGIYGLVVSVLISDNLNQSLSLYTGFIQLGAGLCVGLAGLAAG